MNGFDLQRLAMLMVIKRKMLESVCIAQFAIRP
jgi:hypothetical protein